MVLSTPPINNSLNHQEMRTRGSSQVRQKCPRCGSSRWRRDPNRGIITCGEGHLLEGYLQESNTQTEPSQHFTRKRRTVVSTRDRIRKGWVLKDVFEGSRARVLHLEALTFLIRQQVNALINTIRAPRILETITRQLWQAYLTTIPLPSDYQTSDNISLNRSKTSSTDSSSKSIRPRSSLSSSFDDRENDLTEESLRVLTTDQSDEERDQEAFSFIPPEQPQSSSEDEDGDPIVTRQDNSNEPSSLNRLSHQAQTSNSRHYPRIELTICTIYLACLKIRLPITLQDIINMVATKEIPYVGFVHALPDHVKMKMNRSTLCAFNIDIGFNYSH
ncbi:hypothetical protein BY996DRAFT_6828942 [Phakopsora pachyrhizi]|nr:hypothetical protein BY996DRAFT_6828942 [Phakopsora pachyrhizi]